MICAYQVERNVPGTIGKPVTTGLGVEVPVDYFLNTVPFEIIQ